jgi:hypothetical protein
MRHNTQKYRAIIIDAEGCIAIIAMQPFCLEASLMPAHIPFAMANLFRL